MRLIFLGTSGSTPTPERGLPAVCLEFKGQVFLFDCGENSQVQLMKTDVKFMKVDSIFISHFHGDHFFGLPGLIFTLSLNQRQKPLTVYGPKGVNTVIESINNFGHNPLKFEVMPKEVEDGCIMDEDLFTIEAIEADHGMPALSYAFVEKDRFKISDEKVASFGLTHNPMLKKLQRGESIEFNGKTIAPEDVAEKKLVGRKMIYSGDTRPTEKMISFAKNANVLVFESTFLSSEQEKAEEYFHSTAKEAAQVAQKAGVKQLVLIHLSKRYKNSNDILSEALEIFPNTILAQDLMELEITK